jgi:hypothetical protein
MLRFLIHCEAAWCDSNDDLKKVTWKAWALFFVQTVHTSSVSHSQFHKHLIMSRISRRHPLCVAVMHPKKIHAFCGQWPEGCIVPFSVSPALSEAPLTHMALRHVIGSFSQATSEDRHIGDATACILIQFWGAYWKYWKNCPHLLFVSQHDE